MPNHQHVQFYNLVRKPSLEKDIKLVLSIVKTTLRETDGLLNNVGANLILILVHKIIHQSPELNADLVLKAFMFAYQFFRGNLTELFLNLIRPSRNNCLKGNESLFVGDGSLSSESWP